MRIRLAIILPTSLLMAIPLALADNTGSKSTDNMEEIYRIILDKNKKARIISQHPETGKEGWFMVLDFQLEVLNQEKAYGPDHGLIIEEDGIERLRIPLKRQGDLTIILAMDMGGSMREGGKIVQARHAADEFLKLLKENKYADPGFIQFNEQILKKIPPLGNRDPLAQESHREKIKRAKEEGEPRGGTGYLNATLEAIDMLKKAKGSRAIVIITDGLDPNSGQKLDGVINEAKKANVQVYTIGVGASGRGNACVLVLDRSGSMARPATDTETKTKMAALHAAACDFVDRLRADVPISIQPFSTEVERPRPFTDNKAELKEAILSLQPSGGTQLYDAMYAGIMSLAVAYPEHNRRLVVMTDGVDEAPGSRHRFEEVIEAAKRENVRLHLVGFGRKGEINEAVMKQMAKETEGTYTHADSAEKLEEFFRVQALESSQQGIDVESLTKLAEGTGGKFASAENVTDLKDAIKTVTQDAEKSFHPVFQCQEGHTGLLRGITIRPVNLKTGVALGKVEKTQARTHGVVPPGINWRGYLLLLALIGALLIVPPFFRRVARFGRAA